MKIITKQEYENALKVLQTALDNKQLVISSTDELLVRFGFETDTMYSTLIAPGQVTFIAADLAIKNTLHELRNKLRLQKDSQASNEKNIQNLESLEQKLIKDLSLLKE